MNLFVLVIFIMQVVFESGMLFIIELGKEMDSYMYQSVGSEVIEMIAKAMNKPLFR